VTGDFTVRGNLTAQQFILSSSVTFYTESFSSGSTRFGDSVDDFMRVTGSLIVSSSTGGPFIVTGSTGFVGIGTNNPTQLLALLSDNTNGTAVNINNISTGGYNWNIFSVGSAATLAPVGSLAFRDSTNGATRMAITSAGNVGIGTSNPSTLVHAHTAARSSGTNVDIITLSDTVTGVQSSGFGVRIVATSNNGQAKSAIAFEQNGGTNNDTAISFYTQFSAASLAHRMIIDRNGNVGIGTDSPEALLHLNKASSGGEGAFLYIDNSAGSTLNNKAGIRFSTNSGATFSGYGSFIDAVNSNAGNGAEALSFGNWNGSARGERMRLASDGVFYTINAGVDGTYQPSLGFMYRDNNNETHMIASAVSSNTTQSGLRFDISNGGGSSSRTTSMTINRSSVTIVGSLSKGSGTFKIDHPLESKKDTHHLVHSFIEGPKADLIYRGKVTLVNGTAAVNIDETIGMTEGTFVALNREVQCFTTNETGWDAVKGKVEGNILTITSQNAESTDEISWMVIGERQDKHMFDTEWTDENGRPILEPLKPVVTPPTEE
jgi:hypothetical protein